jgi:hypothetical protein
VVDRVTTGSMSDSKPTEAISQPPHMTGDVVALLSDLQDMKPGFYLIQSLLDGWATLRLLIDDEARDRLVSTDKVFHVPANLLELFMSVGIRMMALH